VLLVGLADVALSAILFADQFADIGAAGVVGTVMFDERAGLGLVGGIIAPISGFWIYLALGGLWLLDARARKDG
jgi:hypothetical protein